jgi:hypothetical protein
MFRSGVVVWLAACAGGTEEESGPTGERWGEIVARADGADTVFHGEVVEIEYGAIEDGSGGRLPVTYVTYQVLHGIKGGTVGDEVTLRFLGGRIDERHWGKMAGSPTFDVGETDVVMVVDNGTSPCPLVDCAAGRLRVVDGRLYTDDGHALRVDGTGALQLGERHALTEVLEHDLGGVPMVRVPSLPLAEAPDPEAFELDALLAATRVSR